MTNSELIRLFYDLWEATLPGREFILGNELPESLDKLPRSGAGDVHQALRVLNRLGHLIVEGPLDKRFVTSLVGKEVIRTVAKIKPLLDEARVRRADPQYAEYVDLLFELCKAAYPDYEPQYFPEERRGLGLTP